MTSQQIKMFSVMNYLGRQVFLVCFAKLMPKLCEFFCEVAAESEVIKLCTIVYFWLQASLAQEISRDILRS